MTTTADVRDEMQLFGEELMDDDDDDGSRA